MTSTPVTVSLEGTLSQEHLDHTRQLQQQIQANSHVTAFVTTQFAVRSLLDELTAELNAKLGFDFSTLANISSSC